jgi:hypothetical protein
MIESNVLAPVYMAYNRFALEQVGDYRFYNPRGQIVDIVGSVNGFQDFEPIQINRYDNDYEYGNTRGSIMRLLVTKRLQAIRISTISKIAAQKRKLMILKLQEV